MSNKSVSLHRPRCRMTQDQATHAHRAQQQCSHILHVIILQCGPFHVLDVNRLHTPAKDATPSDAGTTQQPSITLPQYVYLCSGFHFSSEETSKSKHVIEHRRSGTGLSGQATGAAQSRQHVQSEATGQGLLDAEVFAGSFRTVDPPKS